MDKLILMENKKTRISTTLEEQNKYEGWNLPDFKTYKATVIKKKYDVVRSTATILMEQKTEPRNKLTQI